MAKVTKNVKKPTKNVSKTSNIKKVVKKDKPKTSKKVLSFNDFSIYFQTAAILLAIAALSLNLCDCIDMNIMLDLFGLSVIFLAFSLFPKKSN